MNLFAVILAFRGAGGGPIGIYGYVIVGAAFVAVILAIVNRKTLAEIRNAAQKAKEVAPKAAGTRWKCQKCGEEMEPEFERCWKCGDFKKE